MSIQSDLDVVALRAGQVSRIEQGTGTTITAVGGILWVTQHGHPKDFILRQGETLVVETDGAALVSPLEGPAVARISAPSRLLDVA